MPVDNFPPFKKHTTFDDYGRQMLNARLEQFDKDENSRKWDELIERFKEEHGSCDSGIIFFIDWVKERYMIFNLKTT